MKGLRWVLGAVGAGMVLFGTIRILQNAAVTKPVTLFGWCAGAVITHDFVLVPLTTLLGVVLSKTVPSRARGYLQGFLVVSAIVMGLALVLHHREGHSSPGNALLTLHYLQTGAVVVGVVAAVTVAAYAVRVLRDRSSSRPENTTTNPSSA